MERRKNLNDKFGFVGKIMRKKTTIKDIACFSKGSQINGDLLLDEGKYEYLNGGTKASGTWNEFNVNGKTITISEGGNSCGYVNFMKEKFWCGAHCYYLFDVKCKPKYLYYLLKGNQSNLMKLRSGACMPNIKKSDLGNFKFIYDSDVIHQDKIISIFDNLTNVIYFYEKQIKYFDNLVKARFIEMFGNPQINQFNWNMVNISKIIKGKVSNGYFAKRDEYCEDGNVKVLGVANIVNRMYSNVKDLPRTNVNQKDISKFKVQYGDMLFCRSSLVAEGIGKASIIPKDVADDILFECHVIRLPLDLNQCVPEFMQVLSTTDYFRNQVIAQSKTSTMTTIGQDGILKTNIILPPIYKQKEFELFVQQVDKSRFDIKKSIIELEREVVYD